MGKIVNAVGSGNLGTSVDIEQVASESADRLAVCEVQSGKRLNVQFEAGGPVITIRDSGRYTISGVKSSAQLQSTNVQLLQFLENKVDVPETEDTGLTMNNLVYVGDLKDDLGLNHNLNLEELNYYFGSDTTYPDRPNAAIVYRMPDRGNVAFITESGKIIVSGPGDKRTAEEIYCGVKEEVSSILGDSPEVTEE